MGDKATSISPRVTAAAERFDRALADPARCQRELLARILAERADTAYGRAHGFARLAGPDDFRRAVPAVSWDDLAPWVDRMLDGEPDVLVAGRPAFFARTSGTSGKPKHVGYPAATEDEYLAAFAPLLCALERDHPGAAAEAMVFSGKHREDAAKDGTPIGSASGYLRNLPCFRDLYFHFAPEEVFELVSADARYYAMLRFALARPLVTLWALNASSLLLLFKKAHEHGEALAHDLARGTLEAGPDEARAIAPRVAPALRPEPEAAARLQAALAGGTFSPRIAWPRLSVIQTWKGGSGVYYLNALEERCPGVAIRPAVSGSTEGLLAVPLADSWAGGVPALTASYLEYLPAESAPSPESFVPLDALEEGRGYRLALTNLRGLHRYLMDDVFYLEGRHRGVPILRYSHRHGLTSSLTGEKLTEADVDAAARAAGQGGARIAELQLAPEWDDPPRYVALVELGAPADDAALDRALTGFEAGLAASNVEYASKRASGRLGPPSLLVLEAGAFDRMRREATRGRSDAQVKLPRLVRAFVDRRALAIARTVEWPRAPAEETK